MKTTKTAKTATPTRGTAKALGLKVGDTFVYFGKDKAPGLAATAVLVNEAAAAGGVVWLMATRKSNGKRIETIGGAATKFWAAPAVTTAPKVNHKAVTRTTAINSQCECHLIMVSVPSGTKLTKTQKAASTVIADPQPGVHNGLVQIHYQCNAETARRFAPGHDARYHGLEALAARTEGAEVAYYTEDDLPQSMR